MPIGTAPATASAHRKKDVDGIASGPSSSRATGFVVALSIVALGAYFVGLHALVASHAWPTTTIAMILVPWLFVIGPRIARAFHNGAFVRRVLIAALSLGAVVVVGVALMRYGRLFGEHADALLFIENIVFFGWLTWLFASSLTGPREPLVTQMARTMRLGDMPPPVIRYTRFVTIAWVSFFVVVMALSTVLFVTQSREVWSLFVNVLIWPLVVVAFVVEYAVRRTLLSDVKHIPFSAAIHAFRGRSDGER